MKLDDYELELLGLVNKADKSKWENNNKQAVLEVQMMAKSFE
ncbi:hypothetical protein [Bathymodiolus thermophilus thioautotrophic gill symbiont]|nr:hypothetical protein [Bathymodiolus thermophilus thioautotrophic gill symbiont]